jgi:hypothetical protein
MYLSRYYLPVFFCFFTSESADDLVSKLKGLPEKANLFILLPSLGAKLLTYIPTSPHFWENSLAAGKYPPHFQKLLPNVQVPDMMHIVNLPI